MLKKIKERQMHLLILAFLAGLFIGINTSFISAAEPAHKYLDYFHRVYQLIVTEYVDDASPKDMFFGAIRGMMYALNDPFSRFLDEKSFEELKEMTTGKFLGAGIMPGDVITRINGKPVKGVGLEKIEKMIRGLPKSSVKLQISREGYGEPLEFELERAPVKIKSVEYGMIDGGEIGYLRIKNFGSDTARDTATALSFFNDKGARRIVLDLRNNPGGLLTSSVEVSELFLDKGNTIVSTRGREGSGRVQVFKSQGKPLFKGRLIVLVNGGTASAAEILSAAVRDNGRGKLLGVKTFGKGSVQKTFNLDDDVGVAITVARYYTPSGEMIHKKGLTPDYVVPQDRHSAADMAGLKIVRDKRLLEGFATHDTEYTTQSKEAFQKYLTQHGVTLSGKAADFILKEWIYRSRKRPLYDLEFDNQLNEAIKYISAK
jgi:carboxyl-terminal processing protease